MKVALITSIFGGIDEPKKVPAQSIEFTHYHFTEASNPTQLRKFNDRTRALYFKTQHHRVINADYYIYIDGKIQILSYDFIEQCLYNLDDNSFSMALHPAGRNCIYEEVDYIESEMRNGSKYLTVRYEDRNIRQEVEYYRLKGYPSNNGLNDCAIFARKNDDPTNQLFNDWWEACMQGKYDQIAIQYLAWSKGIEISPLILKPYSFKQVNHLLLK